MRLLLLITLASIGCAHKQVVTLPTEKVVPRAVVAVVASPGVQEQPTNEIAVISAPLACAPFSVHFDFNEALIRRDDREVLAKFSQCAKKHGAPINIEGYADERGTEEYNLALSDRRAQAVKAYLTALGVKRCKAVGYGKTRPVCVDHEEACWQQNRRAEVK